MLTQTASPKPSAEALLPIRTVASQTGVNAVTLRAWERRYGILQPQRTPKGHRLYTLADVELVHWIVEQLGQGISISRVRQLMTTEPPTARSKLVTHRQKLADPEHIWAEYQSRMVNALTRFDEARLDAVYHEALSLYPIGIVTQRLIFPLLKIIGMRWEKHHSLVSEEHFFSTYLRNKIGARLHHQHARHAQRPKLICACLPGEYHEVGLLLFCLAAIEMDFQVIILGANTPMGELPVVVQRSHADGIILSGTHAARIELIDDELAELTGRLNIPVFIGGRIATLLEQRITEAGGIPIGEEISEALKKIQPLIHKTTVPI